MYKILATHFENFFHLVRDLEVRLETALFEVRSWEGHKVKAGPLDAILVIFGRRALIFSFESSWKNEK